MAVLLVLMTLIIALTLDHVVQKLAFRRQRLARDAARGRSEALVPVAPLAEAPRTARPLAAPPLPGFLDPSHCWIALEPSGLVTVGADALATALLGPPDRVSVEPTGTFVARGEPLLTLYRGHRRLTLRAPVSGLVAEHNVALGAAPAVLAEQPYGPHWLCRVQPQELGTALRAMLIADEATRWLRGELRRAREALLALHQPAAATLGVTASDGGLPEPGLSAALSDDQWQELARGVFGEQPPVDAPPPA